MPEFIPQHVPTTEPPLDDFTRGYLSAAEWTSADEIENATGWSADAIAQAISECAAFQAENIIPLAFYYEQRQPSGEYSAEECAGHDFWLTRCGHGAGFWDRDEVEETTRDILSAAAKAAGNRDVYTADPTTDDEGETLIEMHFA